MKLIKCYFINSDGFKYGSRYYGFCGNFVAKFKTPFNTGSSDFENFWIYKSLAQRIKYMYSWDNFYYGYIESLNASWIKLPLEVHITILLMREKKNIPLVAIQWIMNIVF